MQGPEAFTVNLVRFEDNHEGVGIHFFYGFLYAVHFLVTACTKHNLSVIAFISTLGLNDGGTTTAGFIYKVTNLSAFVVTIMVIFPELMPYIRLSAIREMM